MCHVKCYTNSFSKNLPILTSLQLQGFKIIIKHTSLCNTDGKPNINVNVSGQRVHQHRALPDSGSLGWSYIGRPYLSITLASMMLQYTDPEVYGQNNMEASVCEGYVHCTEEYRTWNRTSRCSYNLCTFDGKTEQKSSLQRVKVDVHVLNSYSDYYRINLQALLLKSSSDWKCYLNDCSYKSIFTHFFFNNSQ